MEAMETGRHEEGRGEHGILEAESGMAVFVSLASCEAEAQQHRDSQALDQALAITFAQRMMRPGDGAAGGQQDQGVEQGQIERIKRPDRLWRPDMTNPFLGEQRSIKESPEESREKHHFGSEEQGHAIAQADLHHAGMLSLMLAFVDDVGEPEEHGAEDEDNAGHDPPDRRQDAQRLAVHELPHAEGEDKGTQRAGQRPRAGIDQMIRMIGLVGAVGCTHFHSSLALTAASHDSYIPKCTDRSATAGSAMINLL